MGDPGMDLQLESPATPALIGGKGEPGEPGESGCWTFAAAQVAAAQGAAAQGAASHEAESLDESLETSESGKTWRGWSLGCDQWGAGSLSVLGERRSPLVARSREDGSWSLSGVRERTKGLGEFWSVVSLVIELVSSSVSSLMHSGTLSDAVPSIHTFSWGTDCGSLAELGSNIADGFSPVQDGDEMWRKKKGSKKNLGKVC